MEKRMVHPPSYLYPVAPFICLRRIPLCRRSVVPLLSLSFGRLLYVARNPLEARDQDLQRDSCCSISSEEGGGGIRRASKTLWFASETLTMCTASIDLFRGTC